MPKDMDAFQKPGQTDAAENSATPVRFLRNTRWLLNKTHTGSSLVESTPLLNVTSSTVKVPALTQHKGANFKGFFPQILTHPRGGNRSSSPAGLQSNSCFLKFST